MLGKVKCAVREWFQKQNTNFLKTDLKKKTIAIGASVLVRGDFVEKNYAALKIM